MLKGLQNHDKELLSAIWDLEEWRHILEGTRCTIEILNDHRSLMYFWMSQNLNHWQACWSLFLSRFDFFIIHRAGDTLPSWTPSCVGWTIRPRKMTTATE